MNPMKNAISKLFDSKGLFQNGQFMPYKKVENVVQDNFVNPLISSISKPAQPILDYINPSNYAVERKNPELGTQKLLSAAKAMPNTALHLFGLSQGGVTNPAIAGAVNALISHLTGNSTQEGFQKGVEMSPVISAIGAYANPLISQGMNASASAVKGDFMKEIAKRIAMTAGRIPESILINRASGTEYGKGNLMYDLAQSMLPVHMDGLQANAVRKTIDPATIDEVDGMRDFLNRAIKEKNANAYHQVNQDVSRIADQWLDSSEIDSILNKTKGKQPAVYYRTILDKITKKIGEFDQGNNRYKIM